MLRTIHDTGRVLGTEKIGSWLCNVVEGGSSGTVYRMWVDRKTGFLVKSVSTTEGRTDRVEQLVQLDINQPIKDSVFQVRLDSKCQIIKGRLMLDSPAELLTLKDPADIDKELSSMKPVEVQLESGEQFISSSVIETLYRPTFIPQRYKLLAVRPMLRLRDLPGDSTSNVKLKPKVSIHIEYVDPSTLDTMVLVYGPEAQDEALSTTHMDKIRSHTVNISGGKGFLMKSKVPYEYSFLTWQHNGYHFSLFASQVDDADIIGVADSVTPF